MSEHSSRNTRSQQSLNQNIRSYQLSPPKRRKTPSTTSGSSTMAPEENDPALGAAAQVNLEMIARMCNAFQTSQESLQEFMRSNMTPTVAPTDNTRKIDDCPIRTKDCSLESWLEEVDMWDRIHEMKDSIGYARKYQKVMDCIRKSEDSELIKLANTEFRENKSFKKEERDTIKKMVEVIKTKVGKTKHEVCTSLWNEFIDLRQGVDESHRDFIVKFEQVTQKMKNNTMELPERTLAIHLMKTSTLSNASKENVMTKVNTEDDKKIFEDTKKAIKEITSQTTSISSFFSPVSVISVISSTP
jgi:hypothetical protein